MLKINQIKKSGKFSKFNTADKKQTEAIEQQALNHGRIFQPIFVWKETGQLLYGAHLLKIAQENPELKYTVIEVSLKTQKDAEVWVTEYLLPQPIHLLCHKLVWAIDCEDYWEMKERARRSQGTRTDLSSNLEDRLSSEEVDKIIAGKVGCGSTTVYYFKTVYKSGRMDLIEECEKGEMTISAAYKQINPPKNEDQDENENKKKKTKKPKGKKDPPSIVLNWNIFEDSEKNIDVGEKDTMRTNGTQPDPKPILDKIQKTEVPDGAFWLVFYPDKGVFQLLKKSKNKAEKIVLKSDAYNCKKLESTEDVVILEADHINCSQEIRSLYEAAGFEVKEEVADGI